MIPEGTYDNRSTMRRELWVMSQANGETFLAEFIDAGVLLQKRPPPAVATMPPWGRYPDPREADGGQQS